MRYPSWCNLSSYSPVQHADQPVNCPTAIRSPGQQKLDAHTAMEAPSCPQPSASTYVPVLIYVRLFAVGYFMSHLTVLRRLLVWATDQPFVTTDNLTSQTVISHLVRYTRFRGAVYVFYSLCRADSEFFFSCLLRWSVPVFSRFSLCYDGFFELTTPNIWPFSVVVVSHTILLLKKK